MDTSYIIMERHIRHIPIWISHIPLQNIDTSSSNTVDNTELQTLILASI